MFEKPPSTKDGKELPRLAYNTKEAAEVLRVSNVTVHRLIKRGLLKCVPSLRHKVIPAAELQRFLKV